MSHIIINEKLINFVTKPIIFKQNDSVESCVGILRSEADGRGVERMRHPFQSSPVLINTANKK